ncbi:MAG: cell division protein SepF [Candidatus Altiarchaeota archaeon]
MVLDKLFGGGGGRNPGGEDIDIEDYLNDLSLRDGKIVESEDITYVKPIDVDSDGKGLGNVLAELEKGNVVVLSLRSLMHNKSVLRSLVKELRDACLDMDGDIGRISEDKLLVVPSGMRIVQRGAVTISSGV